MFSLHKVFEINSLFNFVLQIIHCTVLLLSKTSFFIISSKTTKLHSKLTYVRAKLIFNCLVHI